MVGSSPIDELPGEEERDDPLLSFLQLIQQIAHRSFGPSVAFEPKRFLDLSLKIPLQSASSAFCELLASSNSLILIIFRTNSMIKQCYYLNFINICGFSFDHLRGLLASKMFATAAATVTNLVALGTRFGYVVNGARTYYTNRSQPPLLSAMIRDTFNATQNLGLVKSSLDVLVREHQFWNSGKHRMIIQGIDGRRHYLSRYYAKWNRPRPESATIDKDSALNVSDKEIFYRELASAAESGWDFSTRWMRS